MPIGIGRDVRLIFVSNEIPQSRIREILDERGIVYEIEETYSGEEWQVKVLSPDFETACEAFLFHRIRYTSR